jgi:UDP-glucose 4-epimerase
VTERVLVTGAAGFVGSHLCRRLVAEGSVVVGLDDISGGTVDNLRDVPEVRLVEADLRDPSAVADAARGCVTIYHQGAKRSVPGSMKDPEETTAVNVLGTLHVLLAAHLESAVVVSASSSSVYGDQDTFPQSERSTLRPRSPYAASKVAGEVMCASFWRSHGVRTTSLRYFNVYGPGQDPASEYAAVIPRFVVACLTGGQPVVYGDGQQARDFTYIDDVVEANLKAARAPEAAFGGSFNIGGGREPTTVNDLLAQIAKIVGAEPEPVHAPPREGDVRLSQADVSSAHELLGYDPAVSVRDGLRQTVDAFRSSMPVGAPSTS